MRTNGIKAFIFDMDGVIFDSESLYISCCVESANQLGMENIVETCYRCIGVTSEITRRILLETYRDEALVDQFRQKSRELYMEKYRQGELKMKPGVRELLTFLKTRKYWTAVASSTASHIVKAELSEAGILQYFDHIVGGDQVTRSKPDPDIFLRASEMLKVRPEYCAVIEDSFNGIRAARAAGMTAIMVPDLLQPDEEIEHLADFMMSSLNQVREKFETIAPRD